MNRWWHHSFQLDGLLVVTPVSVARTLEMIATEEDDFVGNKMIHLAGMARDGRISELVRELRVFGATSTGQLKADIRSLLGDIGCIAGF